MYDAILLVSFGGPEKRDEVMPFLENVTRGRNIPQERLVEVAEHYYHFGGKSPINDQCRELIAALRPELENHGIRLPIYWGNRNWDPFLADALRQMRKDGVKHALGLVTSAYSSYSGCRQYRENIAAAQAEIGEGAPAVDKIRVFYNHPGFVEASVIRVREALAHWPENERASVHFVVTAHSIPSSAAQTSNYEKQLRETARLVAAQLGFAQWDLVYQSRSGPPTQPWLEPDILDHLKLLHARGVQNVIVAPLGFISDHLEVLFDLDTEAQDLAKKLGMKMVRAATVGTHPVFIATLRQLIAERLLPNEPKLAIGQYGPNHDVCPLDCCPAPQRAGRPPASEAPVALQQP
jgi:ferrochelatase